MTKSGLVGLHLCVTMFSHVCAHTHTHRRTHAHQRGGREAGLPGPSGLSEHQHLAPSTSGALVGKLCPIHRCEFVTAGEQRAATRGVPAPPLGAALLCSSGKASLWICKYFNSQKLQEGVGLGAGVACRPSLCLCPGLLQPPQWQQHSRDMQWCASTIHTTQTGQGWRQWPGAPASPSLGPAPEQGGAAPLTGSAQPQGRGGTSARPL